MVWRRAGRIALYATVLLAALLSLRALASVAVFAAWAWRTSSLVDLSRTREAAIVHAAGQRLGAGVSVDAADVAGTLRRLQYEEVTHPPRRPGEFRRGPSTWEIHLNPRDGSTERQPAVFVRLHLQGARIAAISEADGTRLSTVELEPEVLSGLSGTVGEVRRPVRLPEVPNHLITALLATEDHRFFDHGGIDVLGVLRASWVNMRRGEIAQGGSTLTQQLVKNLALTPKRTWDRKIREAVLAVVLERRYRKADILEAYLNAVYLGHHGGLAVYGVGAAAQTYFETDVGLLSLAESALLAGMVRAPNSYSPAQNLDRGRERRDFVLSRMRDLGLVDASTLAAATREPIRISPGSPSRRLAPYYLDYVRAQAEERLGSEGLHGDLRIYTTLDPVLQRAAERALARGLDGLESRVARLRRPRGAPPLQGAIVALDPATGEIRALVGGRDYTASQFNRATHARRQPGSAVKPFVFLAALRYGPGGGLPRFTPASMIDDEPLTLTYDRVTWTPRNYKDRFEGSVTLRRGLERSLNAATVRLAQEVGLETVIRTARDVGLTSPMAPVPAVSLGGFEVTPLELAIGYATLANGGERVTPTAIRAVVSRGVAEKPPAMSRTAVLRAEEAFVITHLLRGVMDRGTGAAARTLGIQGPVAGKTGTTNEGRDAWFVGYTPRLVVLVWIGFDERDVLSLSGADAALPIWADFMRTAVAVTPSGDLSAPPFVTFHDVNPVNGKLASQYCPLRIREAFLPFTEPRDVCTDHDPPASPLQVALQSVPDGSR
ncbi:MAG: PBP1A family penicillin-binding protein [Candidatus Rokuibacteriota bacterium]